MRCILWDVQVVYAMLLCAFWYQKDIKIVVVPAALWAHFVGKKKSKSMRTKLTDSEKLSSTSTFMIKIFENTLQISSHKETPVLLIIKCTGGLKKMQNWTN